MILTVAARGPDDVLRIASDVFARRHHLSASLVFDAFLRRERAGSTALARGFALPHARVADIRTPSTLFVRTSVPVAFGATDGVATTEFLFILVPTDGNADDHLQGLAAFASWFDDRRFCRRLRRTGDPGAVLDLFRRAIARWTDQAGRVD